MFLAHAYSSFLWLKKKKKRRNRFSSGNHVGSGHMPSKSQSHIQLLEQNGVLLLLLTLAVCVGGGGCYCRRGAPPSRGIAQTSELLFKLRDPISAEQPAGCFDS